VSRPTGIIRTLPSLYQDTKNVGYRRYVRSIRELERGDIDVIYIAMAQLPKTEVLYMYLLIEGQIRVRLNIADYRPGSEAISWDQQYLNPKYWALCSAPVSKPPEKIYRKGFQGFRYTEDLW
jgi:hypothetical protein